MKTVVSFVLSLVAAADFRAESAVAFTHVTVLDMTGAAPLGDRTVVLSGNRISWVGGTESAKIPRGARIVDAAGKFLIPGLWDMHVHFAETERSQKNFFARYRTPEYIVHKKRLYRRELELVGAMHRAGVPLISGTDVSSAWVFPAFSLHDELALLVEAGLTPMEALQAATRNPAEFLGELSSRGTIERGKVADLVLLDANPLEDIRNSRRIRAVVQNGRYLSKDALQEMLAHLEAAAR